MPAFLWLFSALLVLSGFSIMVLNAFSGFAADLEFPKRHRVHGSLWGFQLLGAGSMLSVLLWLFTKTPWSEMSLLMRGTAVVALAWVGAALAIWLAGRVPTPESRARDWPRTYRLFLLLGIAEILALASFAF
jgi:hypothetical protein